MDRRAWITICLASIENMKIKDIVRLIYWEGVPLLTGFILFRYAGVDKANSILDVVKIFISNLYIIIPVIIAHITIGNILFKRKETHIDALANKMMRCKLRKQHGLSYCAKCPDSYTCAGDIKI